jgi:hypothetical protein
MSSALALRDFASRLRLVVYANAGDCLDRELWEALKGVPEGKNDEDHFPVNCRDAKNQDGVSTEQMMHRRNDGLFTAIVER